MGSDVPSATAAVRGLQACKQDTDPCCASWGNGRVPLGASAALTCHPGWHGQCLLGPGRDKRGLVVVARSGPHALCPAGPGDAQWFSASALQAWALPARCPPCESPRTRKAHPPCPSTQDTFCSPTSPNACPSKGGPSWLARCCTPAPWQDSPLHPCHTARAWVGMHHKLPQTWDPLGSNGRHALGLRGHMPHLWLLPGPKDQWQNQTLPGPRSPSLARLPGGYGSEGTS